MIFEFDILSWMLGLAGFSCLVYTIMKEESFQNQMVKYMAKNGEHFFSFHN